MSTTSNTIERHLGKEAHMKSTNIIMSFTIAVAFVAVAIGAASAHHGHHNKSASPTNTNASAANSSNTQKEENKATGNPTTPVEQKSSPSGHKK